MSTTTAASPPPLPTLYHVPRTISSPIYQALMELDHVVIVKDDHNDNDIPSSSSSMIIKVVTLTFADLKKPSHLARNPMGTSPTFVDVDKGVDGILWESGAVLTYLLHTYDTQYKLHPKPNAVSPKVYAKFLQLQQYIIATVYPFVASLFLHTLKPLPQQDHQYVTSGKNTWTTKLAPTLITFLGDSPYFMGSSLSAIDLLVAKPLNNANSMGLLEDFPTLQTLFHKIKSLKSFAIAYNEEPPQVVPPTAPSSPAAASAAAAATTTNTGTNDHNADASSHQSLDHNKNDCPECPRSMILVPSSTATHPLPANTTTAVSSM